MLQPNDGVTDFINPYADRPARERSSDGELSHTTRDGDIYTELARHQQAEKWFARDLSGVLQEWAGRFNVVFKLDIPEVVIQIDILSRRILGHFRCGHNGFGLRGEIAINARYLNGQRQPGRPSARFCTRRFTPGNRRMERPEEAIITITSSAARP